jgi:glycosyltransferase involved in cell wall biosynthesis
MSNSPVLTIITPVYNGENYISETIESVLQAEIIIPFEYIVINDGSQDSTANILHQYQEDITLFNQKNVGEAATVNRGLGYAKGEYILVLSADDPLLTGNLISKAVELMASDPDIVAIYPDWQIINEQGEVLSTKKLPDYSDEVMVGKSICLPGPGTIFRRDPAIEIGGRDHRWKYVSDFDFWLRLSRKGKIVHLPEMLSQWRANQHSTSISQRNSQMSRERIQVIEEFLLKNQVSPLITRNALGNAYYLAARLSFFDKNIDGRTLIIKAIKKQKGIPSESRFLELVYLLLFPLSSKLLKLVPNLLLHRFLKEQILS